jgi:acylaminoacyl-peptidase
MTNKIRKRLIGIVLTTGMALGAVSTATAHEILGYMDTFNLEVATSPQMSPDGERVVYSRRYFDIMTDRAKANLWIVNSDGSNHRPLTSGTNSNGAAKWSPSGDRIAYVSNEEGSSQIYMRWMDTGQTSSITKLTSGVSNLTWTPDGKHLAFTMFVPGKKTSFFKMPAKPRGAKWMPPAKVYDNAYYRADGRGLLQPGFTHVFIIPAEGGTPHQITSGNYNHRGPLGFSPDVKTLYISANRNDDWEMNRRESEIYAMDIESGKFTALTDRKGPDSGLAVSPNGKLIAYTGYDDRSIGTNTNQIYLMNSAGSGKRMIADNDRSFGNLIWKGNSSLMVQYTNHGQGTVASVSLKGKITVLEDNAGGLSTGRPYSASTYHANNRGDITYSAGDGTHPANVAVIKGGKSKQLTWVNKDLFDAKEPGSVEEIWWKSSADDLNIQGWIVKPPHFDPKKKYPLILEIHGGPHSAYGPYFSMEVQLMASAGYVVFYTNPRGSTSYGQKFAEEIQYKYPGQDYDDLISGVDAVVDLGYVDKDNLFVTGGSGGGVLTAWIVGKTDKFRAAVSAKPVINWYSFALTADGYSSYSKTWFNKMPWEDPMQYLDRSPISLVGNVVTPTMMMTGEADLRTPSGEADQFYNALQLRGIDTAMVRIPDSSHGIASRPSNLIKKVGNIIGWFEKYRTNK